jgi:uncharacterized repeat protein (TIGR01451 family)
MKFRPWKLPTFLVVPLLALMLAQTAGADPGEGNVVAALTANVSANSLNQFKTIVGQVELSEDACGTDTPSPTSSCTVDIVKPSAVATVREADLFCATTGFSGYVPKDGDVTVNASPAAWDQIIPNGIGSNNARDDVTAIVKPVGDSALPGLVTFTITENPTLNYDGCILKVIWDDPTTTQNSILIFFGAQETTGDTFVINFAHPLDASSFATPLEFSLGISFGAQGCSSGQFSQVDVNGARLTTSAGGEDDGSCQNGALITVGGTGDTAVNPPPFAPPTSNPSVPDDELYDLRPFLSVGDTSMTIFTLNPSHDDNIFIANLFLRNVTVVAPGADLGITKIATPDPAFVGDSITYTLTVTNNGPDASAGGTVTDTLPPNVSYFSDDDGCTNVANTVTCPTGPLPSGASQVIHVVVTPTAAGPATNTACVKGNEQDGNPANDCATVTSQVIPKNADLSITKTGPAFVQSGGSITYNITVQNSGPANATNVIVNDPLPAGETLVSAIPSQGTCSGTITCNLGSISSGGSATITIVADVTAPCGSSLDNTATVGGDQPDPNSSNNNSSASAFVYCVVAGGGNFVIGDNNASVGVSVTFWGARWWKLNSLTGGAAPASFKGFAKSPSTVTCGTDWTTSPGNSAPPPPGPLPSFMAVIVASSINQSGSTISGNTVHMVIVRTNPGYEPNPGHPGTGTVVAQIC